MVIVLLKGKWKHLSCNLCSNKNTRATGLNTSLSVKPLGFRNLYVMFPVVTHICSCFHHLNELENPLSPGAMTWHEAGVMKSQAVTVW